MKFDQIDDILSADWLIHKESALKYLPLLLAFVKGQDISAMLEVDEARHKPYIVRSAANLVDRWDIGDANIPENSIAVIPIQGVIMKYGYNGTVELMNRVLMAMNNPRICSILFLVETPGGMTANTDLAANLIKSVAAIKPVYSFVTRMDASAGMWLTSPTKIIASSPMDEFGSLGTKTSWNDWDGIFRKLGAEFYDFYATKSVEKDNEVREFAENKNDKPIIARLDFVNEMFHSAVKENLKIDASSVVFKGNTFFAEEAVKLGLAHGIMGIEETIDMLHQEGLKKIIHSYYK